MGISLQSYRIQIGNFANKNLSIKDKPLKDVTRIGRKSSSSSFKSLFCLFSCVLIATICLSTQSKTTTKLQDINVHNCSILSEGQILINKKYGQELNVNFAARYKFGNKTNGIKILHWNAGARHLKNKINDIEHVISTYRPDILGISEANFKKEHSLEDVQIENYSLFLCNTLENPSLNISRVVVYVHNDIAVKRRTDLMNDTFSSIWLEISLPRKKKFLVGQCYREWQYLNQPDNSSNTVEAQLSRWNQFLQQWEQAISTGLECHTLGDMNLNFLNWTQPNIPKNSMTYKLRNLSQALFDKILPLGIVQCVSVATHFFPGQTPGGLDHYYTTHPQKISEVHAYHQGSSDHRVIMATRYSKLVVRNPRYVKKRSYKNFNPAEFLNAVRNISWWELYSCNDLDKAVTLFSEKLTAILDEMAPVKKYQIRKKYAPWLSNNTKEKINERNLAQKKAVETNSPDDWRRFRAIRNQINNILKKEKEAWNSKRLESCTENTTQTWRSIKSFLGWKSGGPPTQLNINGELKSKPADLAKSMNEFFCQKVENLRQNIPPCNSDPLDNVRKLMNNRTCSFSLRAVHPDEVQKIIKSMKSSKSCGLDNIDAYVIKLACEELTPAITHIINLSIELQKFPSGWKCSKVIPLHKKNEVTEPKNYRPVSLLAITSKILERAIFQQLIEYLEGNNILHPSHHGFRRNHSTATALLEMHNTWIEALEEDEISAVVLLDLSAAFDLVDTNILLSKLKLYGFQGNTTTWLESYLTGRQQQVYVDGEISEPLPVSVGVPQGSILGPLLYILFVNDLPEIIHDHPLPQEDNSFFNGSCNSCGHICCFADDSTYSQSETSPAVLKEKIDAQYRRISKYMACNKLVLNDDKTHLLVMAPKQLRKNHGNFGITLNTGMEIIEPSDHEKMLGCQISSDFTWNNHIRDDEFSMQRLVISRINALKKVSFGMSFKMRKMVANSIVMSRMIYIIQLWGGTRNYLLKSLQVLQNKAARTVTGLGWFTPQSVLLRQCGWLSINQLVEYHNLLLLFKVKNEKKPVYLYNIVSKSFPYETRAARANNIMENQQTSSDITKLGFISKSTKSWNVLPPHIKLESKLLKFKILLKIWIKENVPP